MCQGVTKAGRPCRSKVEPYCAQHKPAVPVSNAEAFAALVDELAEASDVLVQLGHTLAGDMDSGEGVHCPKCKTQVLVARNAALVKQYREIVEVLLEQQQASENKKDDPKKAVLTAIRDTA